MKIKTDFVTNSSSASFIILKNHLIECQIELIYNHTEAGLILAQKQGTRQYNAPWTITENDKHIMGDTSMDNFDMRWFLKEIGIKRKYIRYDHS